MSWEEGRRRVWIRLSFYSSMTLHDHVHAPRLCETIRIESVSETAVWWLPGRRLLPVRHISQCRISA